MHRLIHNKGEVMAGHLFQINASQGGVPKRAVGAAQIGALGLTIDSQDDKVHHGGPDRAVSVFSLERIMALQGEGHPIYPGATGENLTVSGLDWDAIVPGTRLQVGAVLLEVTGYATPCKTIIAAFRGGEFNRIHQKLHPGWSRVYTRVLQMGEVQIGDAVQVVSA